MNKSQSKFKPETILKQIANQHGILILGQSRLKGLILDMMPTAERKHINVLKRAIDEQIGVRLLEMQNDDPSVRQIKINTLKVKFKNDNAFDDTALYIVDCFVHALGWNIPEPDIILPFKEIKIGNQIWADRNLDVSHFRNGDPIPEARTDEEWEKAGENEQPAWCYYDNNPENGKKYGKLYNWYAVNDPRGLAPADWSVACKEGWFTLINFLDGKKDAGIKLKAKNFWEELPQWEERYPGNNESFFNGLPGGYRRKDGVFFHIGTAGHWWFSTECDFHESYSIGLYHDQGSVSWAECLKTNGFSVRCNRGY